MGTMSKIRTLTPAFILTIGGLFVVFMILSDANIPSLINQQSNVVGEVNGEEITYQQFEQVVEQQRRAQQQQTGREDIDMERLREAVWNQTVNQLILRSKIDDLGMQVTDQEIIDVITGPNPPQYLTQGFIDSTGQFNQQAYYEAIQDPQNGQVMVQAEETVRQQKLQEKIQSYLFAGVFVSEAEIKRQFVEQNTLMDFEFAAVKNNSISNDEIKYEEADVKKYYNENKDEFKQAAARKVKYVLVKRQPSKDDSSRVVKSLSKIKAKIQEDASAFKSNAEIYSDVPYSLDTLSLTSFSRDAQDLIFEAQDGKLVGPVATNTGYSLFRVNGKVKGDDTFAKASHILLKTGGDKSDAEVKKMADELYQNLKNGGNFAAAAKARSEDPGSARFGGDLGWFGEGQMVPEFSKACFDGPVGRVQKPVKTNYGYHIILVMARTNKKAIVEKIQMAVNPSGRTVKKLQNEIGDFAYFAEEKGFDEVAEQYGYTVLETPAISEDASYIPGIGNSNAIKRFAFDSDLNEISKVFTLNSSFVVAKVSDIIKEGTKPFEEVKAQATRNLETQLKKEKALSIVQEIVNKNMPLNDELKSFNNKVIVDKVSNFKASAKVPGIGTDFALVNTALDAELNKLAGPAQGNIGAYVVKVTKRTEFDEAKYKMQRSLIRDQLLRTKKQRFYANWIEKAKEAADIVDNRHQFYN